MVTLTPNLNDFKGLVYSIPDMYAKKQIKKRIYKNKEVEMVRII